MKTTDLRCEGRDCPLGIDSTIPRLSWRLESRAAGARQTAYRVLAASSPALLRKDQGDLWDSGQVESGQSHLVTYGGPPLHSRQRVWWKVRVWNEAGDPVAWSAPAWWEMGLLDASDWAGGWIQAPWSGGPRTTSPAPYVRKEIRVGKRVARGRLYITALGLFEASLNGTRVGTDALAPGWTNYRKRVEYHAHDVTRDLREGDNALGVILGDGWYAGHNYWLHRETYGDRPRLLAQLEIEYADGSRTVIATGEDWRAIRGPILESDLIMGESYDARREMPGWDRAGFDDADWAVMQTFANPGIRLDAANGANVRPMMDLAPVGTPVRFASHRAPSHVFDLGQNFAGRVRLKTRGPRGHTITLRYGEMVQADGTLYTANLRGARATDYYTLKGGGEEIYEPHFTTHGFRYVEVNDLAHEPEADTVTGIVLHSDMRQTGTFECSDPQINQLQRNIAWSQRGNFVDIPTDCPQRDERLGWSGDAHVFARTAAFNFDVARVFAHWLRSMPDEQGPAGELPAIWPNPDPGFFPDGGPAWADAAIICPWVVYQAYGDAALLATHYAALVRFMDYLEASSRDLIRVYDGYAGWRGFGDWLNVNAETPKDLIGTAFFAYDAQLMEKIAGVLGKPADARRFGALARRVKQAFQDRFVTPGGMVAGETQTGYILALHFDLLPTGLRPAALDALTRNIRARGTHLSTGFVGTPYLAHVLSDNGRLDLAYALVQQTTYPSWLYPVLQGATTIWERWNSWSHEHGFGDVGMNSFNHYAYGAIGAWLYQVVAGIDIDPQHPGYQRLSLRPRPGGTLTSARATLDTAYGTVSSAWVIRGGTFDWRVIVPPNTTAAAWVPGETAARELDSGTHRFKVAHVDAIDTANAKE